MQPIDDVNKRVSRLGANIPLIQNNLGPLSFTDVPQRAYTEAILGVYELNDVSLLRDVFFWAYERSAAKFAAVQQSLGAPDPFRLKYRLVLREGVGQLIRTKVGRGQVAKWPSGQVANEVARWSEGRVAPEDCGKFLEIVEEELLALHDGNFARYQIRPSEFAAWKAIWKET